MPYTPRYINNRLPDYNDFHFSLWHLMTDILNYYNSLDVGQENYYRSLKNGKAVFGYSEASLSYLNFTSGIEWLLTLQYDRTNTSGIDLSDKSLNSDYTFFIPYQFTVRCLNSPDVDVKSIADPKFRIETIFDKLKKDLCNSMYLHEITPNTINYEGVVQTNLGNKPIVIDCMRGFQSDTRLINEEVLNNRQFVVGSTSFTIMFQEKLA